MNWRKWGMYLKEGWLNFKLKVMKITFPQILRVYKKIRKRVYSISKAAMLSKLEILHKTQSFWL